MNNGDTVRVYLPGRVINGKTGEMEWTREGYVKVIIDGYPYYLHPWDVGPVNEPD